MPLASPGLGVAAAERRPSVETGSDRHMRGVTTFTFEQILKKGDEVCAGPTCKERLSKARHVSRERARILAKESKLTREELLQVAWHPFFFRLSRRKRFEAVTVLVILANAVVLGAEADSDGSERDSVGLALSEHVFTFVFLVEWLIHFLAQGGWWFASVPNVFDTFLVWICGVLPTWIVPLYGGQAGGSARAFTVFRVLRILRVTRLLRILRQRDLWMLVEGIMGSLRSFFWAMVLLAAFIYISALFLRVVVGQDSELIARTPAKVGDRGQHKEEGTGVQGRW